MNLFGVPPSRQRLARSLLRLRVAAGLSQPGLVRRLGAGWSQPKISRIETAKQVVEVSDVAAWAQATGASEELRAELVALAEEAKVGSVSADTILGNGLTVAQQASAELERSAAKIGVYHPVIIPGLLQTVDYIRQIFTAGFPAGRDDIAQAIAVRVARQGILYDPAHRFEFVVPETALRWRFGPVEMLLGQLDRIGQMTSLSNVSVGLIPLDREAPVWHTHGFTVFDERFEDDPLVTVETLTAVLAVSDPKFVEEYRQAFAALQGVAVFDEDARSLLEQIAADMRR